MLGRRATLKTGQQHKPAEPSPKYVVPKFKTASANDKSSEHDAGPQRQQSMEHGASECSANRITLWFQDKVITLWKETHGLKSHLLSNDRLGDPTATAIRSEGSKEFVNMFHAGVGTWKAYVTSDVQVVGVSSQRPALCSSPLFFFCATCDPRLV